MTTRIEKELQEVTFVTKEGGESKQDYLLKVFQAIEGLSGTEWEDLSKGAKRWYNEAVDKYDSNDPLPNFSVKFDEDDGSDNTVEIGSSIGEDGLDDPMSEDVLKAATASETDSFSDLETYDSDSDMNETIAEALNQEVYVGKPTGKIEKLKKETIKVPKTNTRRSAIKNVDRYGLKKNSKSSMALQLFERGATMAEAKKMTGGTHYNILRKLAIQGHKVWQEADGRFFVKHKTEIGQTQENLTKGEHVSS